MDEHEKDMREAKAAVREMTSDMGTAMAEAMAGVTVGAQTLMEEARAWDAYAVAFVRSTPAQPGQALASNVEELAVAFADKLLEARRQRFSDEKLRERLRASLPSAKGQCGKAIMIEGKDTGNRCARGELHDGPCY